MKPLSLRQKLFRTTPMATPESTEAVGSLQRTLGVFSLTMLGVGGTIGTGIFFTLASRRAPPPLAGRRI